MNYELGFNPSAFKEWRKLNSTMRHQFAKKLAERLVTPRIPSAKFSGHPDRYKIKLHDVGYRLIYEVIDQEIVVVVVAVGRRDHDAVYIAAATRDVSGLKRQV